MRWWGALMIAFSVCACGTDQEERLPVQETLSEDFVAIPGGTYQLGHEDHYINPAHEVTLEPFQIGATEVTNAEWTRFIEATDYVTDAERFGNAMTFHPGLGEYEWVPDSTAHWRYPFGRKRGGIEDKDDYPVSCISYNDVLHYCQWAGVRLPTLDEWEVACRAGSTGRHFFTEGNINDYGNVWQSETHKEVEVEEDFLYHSPVGTYQPNAWGLYDMYGNCFEFCDGLPPTLKTDVAVACARGGSWWCSESSCDYFNSIDIGKVHVRASFSNHGFRVVKE